MLKFLVNFPPVFWWDFLFVWEFGYSILWSEEGLKRQLGYAENKYEKMILIIKFSVKILVLSLDKGYNRVILVSEDDCV